MKAVLEDSLEKSLEEVLGKVYPQVAPGIVVSVSHKGRLLYEKSRGLANVTTGEGITARSNFRMASVSKQFTALGIALLERAGRLSFQSRLSEFFPELGNLGNQITLHHLLTHTSGLFDYEEAVENAREHQVTDQEVLEIIARKQFSYFSPGTQFRYSNTGYVLLGLVIEKTAQKPFAQFLREQIFSPLQMKDTTLFNVNHPQRTIPNRVMGYALKGEGKFIFSDQSPCSATQGDGCLYTSVHDYRLWHCALSKQSPYSSLEHLLTTVYTPIQADKDWFYGMGWFFSRRQNGSLELYHTGNSSGFSHLVVSVPEEDALILAFSNVEDNPHLLPTLLQTILQHAPFQLQSDLVWHLPVLTR